MSQKFMTLFSDRDALSTWIPAVRCAEKVHPPRNEGHLGYVLTSISGKTSLILSLAAALGLDIYTVSLSSMGRRMNDSTLMALMANISTP